MGTYSWVDLGNMTKVLFMLVEKNTLTFHMGKTKNVLLPYKDYPSPKSSIKEEGNALLTLVVA